MSILALALLGGAPSAEAGSADTVAALNNLRPELPPGFGLDMRSFVFPTGLRVIMQPDHSAPIVAVTTYIDHGSSSDPKGLEGIAHFLEHMWFKSRHIEGSQVKTWDVLEEAGCDLNASTSMDWTNYMSVCPKSALPTLMKFASLRLTDTVKNVRPEEADSEREVIRNELRMRSEGQFEGRNAYQYALKSLFPPDHPYNRLGIGTHDSLDNVTLEDIKKFAEDFYRPEETTIVVVGDFEPQEAGSLIVENFDPKLLHEDMTEEHIRITPRPGVSVREIDSNNVDREKVYFVAMDPANPRQPLDIESNQPIDRREMFGMPVGDPYSRELQTFEAPVTNQTAVVAWSVPPGYQGNDIVGFLASAQVSNALLYAFIDEYDVVKDADSELPNTGCSYLAFQENSMMMCLTEVKKGRNAERIAEKMLDQLTSIWNPEQLANPIARQQIDRFFGLSKLSFMQTTFTSMDRVSGLNNARATLIGSFAHHTGDHQYYSNQLNAFGQVEMAQVLSYVEQYISRERAAKFVLQPLPDDKLVLDSSESDYVGASSEDDQIVSTLSDDEITTELIVEAAKTPDFDKVVDKKLANGLRVVIYPHGEAPLASIRLVSQGGSSNTKFPLDEVVDVYASEGFRVDLEPLAIAGDWEDGSGSTSTFLGIDAPALNADDAIWYLRKRLEGIKPDFGNKGDFIREWRDDMRRDWQSGGYWSRRLVNEAMGGDHPAFYDESWDDITRAKKMKKGDVQAYIDRKYHPENMTLIAVGAFDVADVEAAAQKYFGGWATEAESFEPMPVPGPAPILEHEPLFYVLDSPRRTQTSITAHCRMADGGPERRADLRVVGAIFDGYLFAELRAKEGITYGSGAGVQQRVGGTNVMRMSGLFQNDGVGIATDAFVKVATDGSSGVFPMNRFKPAQLALARKPVLGLQAIEDVADSFVNTIGRGWTYDVWGDYGQMLADVTPESMQEAMAPCADTLVITYSGPEKIIGPVLEEAGYDYEKVDARALGLELFDQHDKGTAKKIRKRMEKEAEQEEAEGTDGDEESDAG